MTAAEATKELVWTTGALLQLPELQLQSVPVAENQDEPSVHSVVSSVLQSRTTTLELSASENPSNFMLNTIVSAFNFFQSHSNYLFNPLIQI